MKGYILIAITLFIFGCSEEQLSPTAGTVHLAGYLENSPMEDGDGVASYWKDRVYNNLTSGNILSRVSSMYVDGSSVIIGGSKRTPHSRSTSVFWREGVETVIEEAFGGPLIASRNNKVFGAWLGSSGWVFNKNGTSQPIIDTAYNFALWDMAVFGDDMYTSGFSSGPPLPPNYSPPQHGQYWKNGQLIFRENQVSTALSIFVHQNNIYMAGILYPTGGTSSIACYWKNGKIVNLTDGSVNAVARSMFVTDTHVYVSGMIDNQAAYWKDGESIKLTTGTDSMANSIFVQGKDVHVGGYQSGHPAYWKNNVRQRIANQDKFGKILFVVVGSN